MVFIVPLNILKENMQISHEKKCLKSSNLIYDFVCDVFNHSVLPESSHFNKITLKKSVNINRLYKQFLLHTKEGGIGK